MTPEQLTRHQERMLEQKVLLLEEMLEITREYNNFLSNITTSKDVDEVIERTEQFLGKRDQLMKAVDQIDGEYRAIASEGQHALRKRIHNILAELVKIQPHIDKQLADIQSSLRLQVGKTRRSRQLVKGYYNQQLAERPRFVDDKC